MQNETEIPIFMFCLSIRGLTDISNQPCKYNGAKIVALFRTDIKEVHNVTM